MAAGGWVLMLCLVRERPSVHLPTNANDRSADAAGRKVSQRMVLDGSHSQLFTWKL